MPRPFDVDLTGKIALVTGANRGIGKEIARNLLALGARVLLGCRSPAKGETVRAELAEATGHDSIEVLPVDVADLASIERAAGTVLSSPGRVDILVHNAGVWLAGRETTPDGIERTWATNVLGPAALSRALGGALEAAAPSRIVYLSSRLAGGLDLDDPEFRRRRYRGIEAYAASRQATRMLAWIESDLLAGRGIQVSAASPGSVRTRLVAGRGEVASRLSGLALRWLGRSVAVGADTPTWLAASPEVEGRTGGFWHRRRERACPFRDREACLSLVRLCEETDRERAARQGPVQ